MPSLPSARRGSTASNNPDRQHRRRRDGCVTCKKRRVKCGREKAVCAHCERLNLKCDWPDVVDVDDATRPSLRRKRSVAWGRERDASTGAIEHIADVAQQDPSAGSNDPGLPPYDFDLDLSNASTNDVNPSLLSNTFDFDVASQASAGFTSEPFGSFDFYNGLYIPDLQFDLTSPPRQTQNSTYPVPSSSLGSTVPLPPAAVLRLPVTPAFGDQPIITHFLERTAQWANCGASYPSVLQDPSVPNHWLAMFSAALFYQPLFDGIMAWSACHLANSLPVDSQHRREVTSYARHKHSANGAALLAALANDDDEVTSASIDLLLSAILVYCQFEIGTGAEPSSVHSLLDLATNLIVRCQATASIGTLSPLAQRSAVFLTSYDIRTSMFGAGSAEYTLRLAAPLFGMSTASPDHQQVFSWHTAVSAQSLHINFLTACCIRIHREIRNGRSTGHTDQVRGAMRQGDELFQRIVSLKTVFDPPSLDKVLLDTYDTDVVNALSVINTLYMSSVYNSIVIYLCRILLLPPVENSLSRIIEASRTSQRLQPDVKRSVFPRPLFFAGLEAKNASEYDWIVGRLKSAVAAGAGRNVDKMVQFLIYVREAEEAAGGVKFDLEEQLHKSSLSFIV